MKSLLKVFIFLLLLFVVAPILVAGYFGFVPVVSSVFGSDKPRDLGVQYTQQDFEQFVTKSGIEFAYMPSTGSPKGSIRFEGKRAIDASFTGAELTALLANDQWEYNFVKQPQIRINADGSEEISGILIKERVSGFLIARGYSSEVVALVNKYLQYVPTNPAFYLKLNAGWQNNMLSMSLQDAQVGRFSIPQDWLQKSNPTVTSVVQNHVLSVPNLTIDSIQFTDGKMVSKGTFPSKLTWSK